MQPPAITRRRRPFLAPFWVMWLIFFALLAAAFVAYRAATTTTIVLVRHAEKVMGTIEDPPLASEGARRADRLAQMFGEITAGNGLDAIYVSDTKRARQTAGPLLARLGFTAVVYPAADVDGTVRQVLRNHRGGRALIVGHSNTLPAMIQKLTGQTVPPIPEEEYDDIYVVTVPSFGRSNVLRLKY